MDDLDRELREQGLISVADDQDAELRAEGLIEAEPVAGESFSKAESFGMGAQQGLMLNTADETGAALGAILEAPGDVREGMRDAKYYLEHPDEYIETAPGQNQNGPKGLEQLYNEYLDFNRKRHKAASDQNSKSYVLGEIGGGVLLPAGGSASLAKGASLGQKMKVGAQIGAPLGALNAAGASEAPIGSGEFATDVATGGGIGLVVGGGAPAALKVGKPIAKASMKGLAGTGKWLSEKIFGPIGGSWEMGIEGTNAISKEGVDKVKSEVGNFAGSVGPALVNEVEKLAQTKNELIEIAHALGIKLDPTVVDEFIKRRLGDNPRANLPEVTREMERYREILRTAKSGPEVEKIERVFYGDKPTKIEQFKVQAAAREQLDDLNRVDVPPKAPDDVAKFEADFQKRLREQEAIPGGTDPNPIELQYEPTGKPGEVHGIMTQAVDGMPDEHLWNKVESKVITNDPKKPKAYKKQIEQLKLRLAQKKVEQKALSGADQGELELIVQPTGIAGKEVAIIRQRKIIPGKDAHTKKVASKILKTDAPPSLAPQKYELIFEATDDPNLVLAVHRRPVVDEAGKIVGYEDVQSKLLPREEAAKFKDVSVTGRTNDRDLTELPQMYDLYKSLKAKSNFARQGSFQTDQALAQTGDTIKEVQGMLRNHIPKLQTIDDQIAGTKRAAEVLGIDTMNLNEQQVTDRIISMISQEGKISAGNIKSGEKLKKFFAELELVNKPLADSLKAQFPKLGSRLDTIQEIQKPISLLSLASPLAITRTLGTGAANLAGYGVHNAQKAIKAGVSEIKDSSALKKGASKFSQGVARIEKMTPEWIQQKIARLQTDSSAGAQELVRLLNNASADDRARNAILVGIMMNPAYRKMLEETEDEQQSP